LIDAKMVKKKANRMRQLALEAIANAGSGHPGGSLSAADIVATLYFYKMRINPKQPAWSERDRFVLSKGHACPILYAALAEKGYITLQDLKSLRQIDSFLQGHPDMKHTSGIDMSTGSLGQGISAAVGMAYAAKMDKKDYRIYCLMGDGECDEGQVWEAVMSAAQFDLNNLVVIVDYNHLQIDGTNEEIMNITNVSDRFKASRWQILSVDGHDIEQVGAALDEADRLTNGPVVIIANTIKGKGVSFMENKVDWHGKAPNSDELKQAIAELGGVL
jgi:transketolase